MVRKCLWFLLIWAVGLLGLFLLMGLLGWCFGMLLRLFLDRASTVRSVASNLFDGAGQVLLPEEEPSKREIVQESLLELSRAIRKEADALERNHLKTG